MTTQPVTRNSLMRALAAVSILVAGVGTGGAQELCLVGRTGPALPTRIASLGTHVVIGTDSGLMVVASDDSSRVLGEVPLRSGIRDLARMDATLTAAAAGDAGLLVLSTEAPLAPRLLAEATIGHAVAVAASGRRVAVGLEGDGDAADRLVMLDASDSAHPEERAALDLPGPPTAIALLGEVVAVAIASPSGVLLIGETEEQLVPLTFIPTMLPARRLAHVGHRLMVACGIAAVGEIVALDVSDRLAPARVGGLVLADEARDLAIDGDGDADRVLVAASALGAILLHAPATGEWSRVAVLSEARTAVAVSLVQPGVAMVARRSSSGESGVTRVHVDAAALSMTGADLAMAEVVDVARTAAHSFVLRRDRLDVHSPIAGASMDSPIGTWTLPDADFSRLAVGEALAAVAAGPTVHVLDLSAPATPRKIGELLVSRGAVTSMALDGALLAVAQGRDMEVHDLSTPARTRRLAVFPMSEGCLAVAAQPGRLVAVGGRRLIVVDTRDLAHAGIIGQLALPASAHAVAASGDGLIVGSLEGRLLLVHVDERGQPELVSSTPTEPVAAVALEGPRVVAVHPESGLAVFARMPAGDLLRVASTDLPGSGCAVALAGFLVDVGLTGGGSFHFEMMRPALAVGLGAPVASRVPLTDPRRHYLSRVKPK